MVVAYVTIKLNLPRNSNNHSTFYDYQLSSSSKDVGRAGVTLGDQW